MQSSTSPASTPAATGGGVLHAAIDDSGFGLCGAKLTGRDPAGLPRCPTCVAAAQQHEAFVSEANEWRERPEDFIAAAQAQALAERRRKPLWRRLARRR